MQHVALKELNVNNPPVNPGVGGSLKLFSSEEPAPHSGELNMRIMGNIFHQYSTQL